MGLPEPNLDAFTQLDLVAVGQNRWSLNLVTFNNDPSLGMNHVSIPLASNGRVSSRQIAQNWNIHVVTRHCLPQHDFIGEADEKPADRVNP